MSLRDTFFDLEFACPLGVLSHDLSHSYVIERFSHKNIPEIYHKIISSDFTKIIKELMIFVLWVRIHEYVSNDFIKIKPIKYLRSLHQRNDIVKILTSTLDDEINKFAILLEDSHNTELLMNIFGDKYGYIYDYNWILVMLLGYAYIITYIIPNTSIEYTHK